MPRHTRAQAFADRHGKQLLVDAGWRVIALPDNIVELCQGRIAAISNEHRGCPGAAERGSMKWS